MVVDPYINRLRPSAYAAGEIVVLRRRYKGAGRMIMKQYHRRGIILDSMLQYDLNVYSRKVYTTARYTYLAEYLAGLRKEHDPEFFVRQVAEMVLHHIDS